MSATARLVVQMTPQEKKALESRARKAGISTAEYVRKRVAEDDLTENKAEIEALLDAMEKLGPSMLAALDRTIEDTKKTLAALPAQ